jgi:hypothetical protein
MRFATDPSVANRQIAIHNLSSFLPNRQRSGNYDYPWVVRKGRVIRPLASRFDSDFVVHGDSQLLLTAEVMLGRLDGHMPEQELDLVELTAGQMTEAGTCAPQVMGCQLVDSGCPQPLS